MKIGTTLSQKAKSFLYFFYTNAWVFIYIFIIAFIISLAFLIFNFYSTIRIQHQNLKKIQLPQTSQPILIEYPSYVLADGSPAELTFYWYWDNLPSDPLEFTLVIPENLRPLSDVPLTAPNTIQVSISPRSWKPSPATFKLPLIEREQEMGSLFQLSQPQTIEIQVAGKKFEEITIRSESQLSAALRRMT